MHADDPALAFLKEIVAIESVNPSLVPGAAGEGQVAEAVAARLRGLGLDVAVREVAPGRPNVVGVLEGRERGPSLMFCGHLDTVGTEGMEAPFDPIERDGRLYGRGTQDMKGGVAAMVDAARVVLQRGFRRGRLIVAAVIDEEYASLGADALVREWTADAAIVTEPTDLQIGVGHKGFAWFEILTRGLAAHGSRPREGRDAILRMGRVLQRLEALDRALQARPPDPVMGTPSLHASTIDGGGEWSVYPAACRLRLERRTVTGETGESAGAEIAALLDELRREDEAFEASMALTLARPPYAIAPGHALTAALRAAAAGRGPAATEIGMTFWTDAAVLAEAGIPALLYGPGGAGLHGTDEYVRTAEVLTCRDVLAALALAWGGDGNGQRPGGTLAV